MNRRISTEVHEHNLLKPVRPLWGGVLIEAGAGRSSKVARPSIQVSCGDASPFVHAAVHVVHAAVHAAPADARAAAPFGLGVV
jgi:hypothetical protein